MASGRLLKQKKWCDKMWKWSEVTNFPAVLKYFEVQSALYRSVALSMHHKYNITNKTLATETILARHLSPCTAVPFIKKHSILMFVCVFLIAVSELFQFKWNSTYWKTHYNLRKSRYFLWFKVCSNATSWFLTTWVKLSKTQFFSSSIKFCKRVSLIKSRGPSKVVKVKVIAYIHTVWLDDKTA